MYMYLSPRFHNHPLYSQVVGEIEETVRTGLWVGDCFIYTNSVNRLNYYVGGEIVTISHLDRYVNTILQNMAVA